MKALLFVCILLFVAVFFFFVGQNSDSAHRPATVINTGEEPLNAQVSAIQSMKVSALQLFQDYQRNEVAADNVYKGRLLAVQGTVTSISKDMFDKIYVSLATPNEFMNVQVHLNKDNESQAAALQRGEVINVVCTGGGMILGSPMLEKCSFASARDNSENLAPPQTSQQNTEVEENAVSSASMDSTNNIYKNERYGFSIQRPQSFIAQRQPENGDGLEFKSKDGQASLVVYGMNNGMSETPSQLYQEAIKDAHGTLGYTKLADTWFVVTWQDGETIVYEKMFVGPGSYNAFTFTYPKTQQEEYTDTVTTLAKSFRPGDISQGQ
jgi:hypothetical protein